MKKALVITSVVSNQVKKGKVIIAYLSSHKRMQKKQVKYLLKMENFKGGVILKIYKITGFGQNSTCKNIKPNYKIMGTTLIIAGITLTTTHELANMFYILDSLGNHETGKLILQNEQLTKLFLDSPIVKEWVSKPNMIQEISALIKENLSLFYETLR